MGVCNSIVNRRLIMCIIVKLSTFKIFDNIKKSNTLIAFHKWSHLMWNPYPSQLSFYFTYHFISLFFCFFFICSYFGKNAREQLRLCSVSVLILDLSPLVRHHLFLISFNAINFVSINVIEESWTGIFKMMSLFPNLSRFKKAKQQYSHY